MDRRGLRTSLTILPAITLIGVELSILGLMVLAASMGGSACIRDLIRLQGSARDIALIAFRPEPNREIASLCRSSSP